MTRDLRAEHDMVTWASHFASIEAPLVLRHAVLPRPEGNMSALLRHLLLDAALVLKRGSFSRR